MSNRNSRKIELTVSIIATTVALLYLITGTVLLVRECCKIAKVGADLIAIGISVSDYNESTRKTDSMTDEYKENDAYRQAYYHSEDTVIRTFSNLPSLIKGFIWLLAIVSIVAAPAVALLVIYRWVYTKLTKMRHRKYRQEKFLYDHPKEARYRGKRTANYNRWLTRELP